MEDVDREINDMKLMLNRRARTVAESYLVAVSRLVIKYLQSLDAASVRRITACPPSIEKLLSRQCKDLPSLHLGSIVCIITTLQ